MHLPKNRVCFKCGRSVCPGNDARLIGQIALPGQDATGVGPRTRHFLPEFEKDQNGNEVMVCPGSPYRAQYIEGQPRDQRQYPYLKEHEVVWRAAYEKAQKLIHAESGELILPSNYNAS